MKYFYSINGKTADGKWLCRIGEWGRPESEWIAEGTGRSVVWAVACALYKLYR